LVLAGLEQQLETVIVPLRRAQEATPFFQLLPQLVVEGRVLETLLPQNLTGKQVGLAGEAQTKMTGLLLEQGVLHQAQLKDSLVVMAPVLIWAVVEAAGQMPLETTHLEQTAEMEVRVLHPLSQAHL
jgi:hypothetical protein